LPTDNVQSQEMSSLHCISCQLNPHLYFNLIYLAALKYFWFWRIRNLSIQPFRKTVFYSKEKVFVNLSLKDCLKLSKDKWINSYQIALFVIPDSDGISEIVKFFILSHGQRELVKFYWILFSFIFETIFTWFFN